MMMDKVVLTKEQAEAIETLKKEKSFREIIWLNLNANTWGGTYVEKPKRIIVKMNFDDLIKALYIGYEVKPDYVPFEEAMKAHEEGKTVYFHGKNGDFKYELKPDQKLFRIDMTELQGWPILTLYKGKWSVAE